MKELSDLLQIPLRNGSEPAGNNNTFAGMLKTGATFSMKFLKSIFAIVIIFNSSNACSSAGKTTTANSKARLKPEQLDIPDSGFGKIAFLNFAIARTGSNPRTYTLTLKNKRFVSGQLKESASSNTISIQKESLYYQLTATGGTKSAMMTTGNPLYLVLEYPADNHTLSNATIEKQQGDLFIRLYLTTNDKYLTIYKPSDNLLSYEPIYYATL